MNLTETKPADIITYIEQNFNRAQATGLNCLIFLSLREQTSVAYQYKEWGFDDIPECIISQCDSLEEDSLLVVSLLIGNGLWNKNIPAAVELENAQPNAVQAIEPNLIPSLLSDYSGYSAAHD